ncbi:MAG: malto-oligosyltrehalose trehalohydrolase [Acidobacteriota bacterium]|jgi:maltooligosyltrehalose trehalohydrolase
MNASSFDPIDALGAVPLADGRCRFTVWAPRAERVEVRTLGDERRVALEPGERGYFRATVPDVATGARYLYRLDGAEESPDPASRLQPDGVHGPSQVVDTTEAVADDGWRGVPRDELVFYELHVGAYSPSGSFAGILPHLDGLSDLGVTALQLMPVAQFPGARNWGYDGVFPFAVHNTYGGPSGLAELVRAAHSSGLAVVLDVVYNHLGPEGNVLGRFGPYFTDRYRTPWGDAVNFDGPGSDEVRRFFLESARQWIVDFGVDGLRVDAIHGIFDHSPITFLRELTEMVHRAGRAAGREVHVIAEDDRNDDAVVRPADCGGEGFDAQWSDDFHHALHALLTGERAGYYGDFGSFEQLVDAYSDGFVYTGQYSSFRRRRHGSPAGSVPAQRLVVFGQNHDQVGNRPAGDRLAAHLLPADLRLAAAVVLLSPFLPLLFMGEEYGETSPFPYFVDHADEDLLEAVRRGRRAELADFGWSNEALDPADPQTFVRAALHHELGDNGAHRHLRDYYRELLHLRRTIAALARPSKQAMRIERDDEQPDFFAVYRWCGERIAVLGFNFSRSAASVTIPLLAGTWMRRLDSAAARWGGEGEHTPSQLDGGAARLEMAGRSAVIYERQESGL